MVGLLAVYLVNNREGGRFSGVSAGLCMESWEGLPGSQNLSLQCYIMRAPTASPSGWCCKQLMQLGREHIRQGARKMANNVSSSAETPGQDTDRTPGCFLV